MNGIKTKSFNPNNSMRYNWLYNSLLTTMKLSFYLLITILSHICSLGVYSSLGHFCEPSLVLTADKVFISLC